MMDLRLTPGAAHTWPDNACALPNRSPEVPCLGVGDDGEDNKCRFLPLLRQSRYLCGLWHRLIYAFQEYSTA